MRALSGTIRPTASAWASAAARIAEALDFEAGEVLPIIGGEEAGQ
jgi:hypothetical protein